MKKNIAGLVITAGLLTLSSSAFSEFYVGGSLGQADPDDADSSTSWEIKTGYRFNNFFAVEAFYLDLGKSEASAPPFEASREVDGAGVSVLGMFPVTEQLEVYGKLGLYSWDASSSLTNNLSPDLNFSLDESDQDLIYGLGVAWKLSDTVKVNLAYDAVDFDESDFKTDIYSIGATVSF